MKAVKEDNTETINEEEFNKWKRDYYRNKMNIDDQEKIDEIIHSYVKGLQWVLLYYYKGADAASWRWFYPYHYSPKITGKRVIIIFIILKSNNI